jgi:hypothetical protein
MESWELPATPRQCRAIAKLAKSLGIREPIEERLANRREARAIQYNLLKQLKAKNGSGLKQPKG